MFNVNFQEDITGNDYYSYLDDDTDTLEIYTDQYAQEENHFPIEYTLDEKNFVRGHFGGFNTYSPLARIQILITKDKVAAYICDEQPEFEELIQSSVTYHTELASIISLLQPIGYQLPTYKGLPGDDITTLNNYITNVATAMQTTKYFEPFLSTAHHFTSEAYLFYSSDTRKPLQEALVFEHIGYDFHWNAYNYFESSTARLLPILHSYKDNSWNIAMVDHKKDLTGIATRTICDSNFKSITNLFL